MKTKKAKAKTPKPRPPGGPITVVLLSSLTELGVVKAVAKNGKTTELSYYARDFGTKAKARDFIGKRLVPEGYRGHVEVIDGSRPEVKQTTTNQSTFMEE